MHVDVHARLTSRLSDIDTNVVAIWRMLGLNEALRVVEQCKNCRLFLGRHVKKVRNVALRNNKNVSTAK